MHERAAREPAGIGARPAFVAFPKSLLDGVVAGRWTANTLKFVLTVIRYTDGHKGQSEGAYISRRFIAEKTQMHERTVRLVWESLVSEGVLRIVKPAAGRRPPKIVMEADPSRWGKHSPDAPPLRTSANAEYLAASEFRGETLRALPRARKDEALCGCQRTPLAGVHAPTSCGCGRAHSEDPEEGLLNGAHDSGSTCEPPLSAPGEERQEHDGDPEPILPVSAEEKAAAIAMAAAYVQDRKQRQREEMLARIRGEAADDA
jgi:hypothetical protein